MRALPLLPLVLSGLMAAPALAASSSPEANDWLNRLAHAEQGQSYQGSFVYERNGSFSSHDIWRRVQAGKVSERLSQLDDAPQEIVRVNGKVQCISGALGNDALTPASQAKHTLDPLKLMSWYDLTVTGRSRVAGRDAVVISLAPRDTHRYGFEYHLDRKTGLLLRSLMTNDKGQLLERFQMTRLDTTPPTDAQLRPGADCRAVKPVPAAGVDEAPAWRADWLPPGFELTDSSVRRDPQRNSQVESLLYDDGLARFSVFLEKVDDTQVKDMRLAVGPTVAVSRQLNTAEGAFMITVVGEVPLGTAERVALSMRPQARAERP
ncbi:MucB/RseB C-terminal domain-containing protein [Pseudomonas alabamensis]|uniref:MucB/RseB C-terminal domain-containing protein n=1 Tax=Pseudomonas alabamensis TaxID=3064349 RepID=UPI0021D817AC|nr:MucB/RseB C-terminal domain-containing protein [Pseudomonas entomophila]